MKVFIGADHRGFELKNALREWLMEKGYEVVDKGALTYDAADDYPDFGIAVGEAVTADEESLGIVICGSGAGISIAAGKVNGVRCGIGFDPQQVRDSRNDDDMNVLALTANFIDFEKAKGLVEAFLETEFEGAERQTRRLEKVRALELA